MILPVTSWGRGGEGRRGGERERKRRERRERLRILHPVCIFAATFLNWTLYLIPALFLRKLTLLIIPSPVFKHSLSIIFLISLLSKLNIFPLFEKKVKWWFHTPLPSPLSSPQWNFFKKLFINNFTIPDLLLIPQIISSGLCLKWSTKNALTKVTNNVSATKFKHFSAILLADISLASDTQFLNCSFFLAFTGPVFFILAILSHFKIHSSPSDH